jgi:FKBP-type peptidyl-prolyl cis-trans isomerase FklB
MKIKNLISFVIIAGAVMISSCKHSMLSSDNMKTSGDSVSYCLGVFYGNQLKEADIEGFNSELMAKGVSEMMNKGKTKLTLEESQKFLQTYFEGLQIRIGEKNLKEGKAFLEENKKKPGIKTTASGLNMKY